MSTYTVKFNRSLTLHPHDEDEARCYEVEKTYTDVPESHISAIRAGDYGEITENPEVKETLSKKAPALAEASPG